MTRNRRVYYVLGGLLLLIYLRFFAEINQFIWDFARSSFGESFFANLFATIIGVGLGIPIALWINRRVETATEKEKKGKILSLLLFELAENHDILNKWYDDGEKNWELTTIGIKLKDGTWDAFSDGGELEWIKSLGMIVRLTGSYGGIKRIKYLSDQYIGFNRMDKATSNIILKELNDAIKDAREDISQLERYWNSSLANTATGSN